ncbi:MAG: hypothetical protein RBG13Loki_0010 [Promethearchaeota archaeon CR_4]|nr:MAG: hypothetical protein RBG13Loki_0010 [Candidatus Lokiarchaeota archaeon CR_4]
MTSIVVEKEILADLVNSKLNVLQEEIKGILLKWHHEDIQQFLTDAKTGKIEDAEDDAICLKNLVEKQEKYYLLRSQWS